MTDFVKLPVYRGFTEIARIFEITQQTNSIICGGYVRYMASPRRKVEPPGDVDIYSCTEDAFEANLKEFDALGFDRRHENDMAVTYRQHKEMPWGAAPAIQVIKPVIEGAIVAFGSMEEILENFDFTVVRVGLLDPETVLADPDFERDEMERKLRFKNIHCPVSSMLRACKYYKKGYWMRPSEAIRLFIDWDDRSESYRASLIDLLARSKEGELSREDVEELEALLRID
jgi:hypothetical protein